MPCVRQRSARTVVCPSPLLPPPGILAFAALWLRPLRGAGSPRSPAPGASARRVPWLLLALAALAPHRGTRLPSSLLLTWLAPRAARLGQRLHKLANARPAARSLRYGPGAFDCPSLQGTFWILGCRTSPYPRDCAPGSYLGGRRSSLAWLASLPCL